MYDDVAYDDGRRWNDDGWYDDEDEPVEDLRPFPAIERRSRYTNLVVACIECQFRGWGTSQTPKHGLELIQQAVRIVENQAPAYLQHVKNAMECTNGIC